MNSSSIRLGLAGAAMLAALASGPLQAEPWKRVAELPGQIALELDEASVAQAMDGARQVMTGTFRKQLPSAMMETSVAVDCAGKEAKIRRVRLLNGEEVVADNNLATADFAPVNEGSAEAFYLTSLCEDGGSTGE